jgi:oligopeptide/dipeptide ABC transporter ATP-binding protein
MDDQRSQSQARPPVWAEQRILEAVELKKYFPVRRGIFRRVVAHVHAVDEVDLWVPRGGTLGLVGESGCGKSTVGKVVIKLLEPDSGRIYFDGVDITDYGPKEMLPFRRRMQIIFQDPYGSLNPRMRVGEAIEEGVSRLGIRDRRERRKRVSKLLEMVGLPSHAARRYPHEFSGGQRQRICIARALSVEPSLIVCDEPVSALDVSVQAQVINLLRDLQRELSLSYLFISHDLHLVEYFSDWVAVMYGGQIMEYAPAEGFRRRCYHPYTQGLIAAVPDPDPDAPMRTSILKGEPPSLIDPPVGCRFQDRCPLVEERCREGKIEAIFVEENLVRCWKAAL